MRDRPGLWTTGLLAIVVALVAAAAATVLVLARDLSPAEQVTAVAAAVQAVAAVLSRP